MEKKSPPSEWEKVGKVQGYDEIKNKHEIIRTLTHTDNSISRAAECFLKNEITKILGLNWIRIFQEVWN